jgi:hypothetical protein
VHPRPLAPPKTNLSGTGAPPRWRLLQQQATRKESIIKRDINKIPIAKREEGSNLVGDWRRWIRGRRRSFLPDLPDESLPRLSAGPGGSSLRKPFSLGGQVGGARLNLHHTL